MEKIFILIYCLFSDGHFCIWVIFWEINGLGVTGLRSFCLWMVTMAPRTLSTKTWRPTQFCLDFQTIPFHTFAWYFRDELSNPMKNLPYICFRCPLRLNSKRCRKLPKDKKDPILVHLFFITKFSRSKSFQGHFKVIISAFLIYSKPFVIERWIQILY